MARLAWSKYTPRKHGIPCKNVAIACSIVAKVHKYTKRVTIWADMAGKWQEIPICTRNVSLYKFDSIILHYKAKSREFPKNGRQSVGQTECKEITELYIQT